MFLRAMLWTYLAMTAVLTVTWVVVLAMGIDDRTEPDHPFLLGAGVISLVWVLVFALCMLAVCLWVYRAHANLFAADFEGLEFTPAWSVGWFFVPFAFWFKPQQAMRELWNASRLNPDGYGAPADQTLLVWWGLWVSGNLALNISTRAERFLGTINLLDVISYLLLGAATWFLLGIVRTITQAQVSGLQAIHALA